MTFLLSDSRVRSQSHVVIKKRAVLDPRGAQRHHYLGRDPSISGLSRVGFGMLPPPMCTVLPHTLRNQL